MGRSLVVTEKSPYISPIKNVVDKISSCESGWVIKITGVQFPHSEDFSDYENNPYLTRCPSTYGLDSISPLTHPEANYRISRIFKIGIGTFAEIEFVDDQIDKKTFCTSNIRLDDGTLRNCEDDTLEAIITEIQIEKCK